MKVNKQINKTNIFPVTLGITFESKEELNLFYELVSSNFTVPELMYSSGLLTETQKKDLNVMLRDIKDGLYEK